MKTVNQRNLDAARQKLQEVRSKSAEILKRQSDEDSRPLTPEESEELAQAVKNIGTLEQQIKDYEGAVKIEDEVLQVGRAIGSQENALELQNGLDSVQSINEVKSLGQMFVESEGFKAIQRAAKEGGSYSEVIRLEPDIKAGTLLSGTLAPGSGQGGGLLTVPQVAPGIVDKLFDAVRVQDVLPTGQTNTNTIRYVVEGTATNSAAAVAEAGTKPASDLALSTVDEQVKKIATALTVSDEMLEDAAQVETYINRRLSLFVRIEEEDEIITGGGANEVTGFLSRSGINTYAAGTVDNNAVALFKALNGTRGSSFLEPDYIVMHPDNWQTTRLLVDSNNQFYGGGPFQGPYSGTGDMISASGQVTGALDNVWGKPVIVTSRIGSGTALLGAFRAASMLYRRSGITVEASNSHSTYFLSNLVALRAESRLALCVFRPAAFTKVTGLS